MKGRRVWFLGKAIADKGLIALHISIEFVSAKEQYKKLDNLLVHRIGKSTLGWHQIDRMGKPGVNVLPPVGSVVFEVWKHWLRLPHDFESARKSGRDSFGQTLDLGLQIVVRHDQRANSRVRIAAARPNGSIDRSVEHHRGFSGASHGYTSALSADAAAVHKVPVPASPPRLGIQGLTAEFLPEKVGVRRVGKAINQVPSIIEQRMMPRA
jgi:hypothetical protein